VSVLSDIAAALRGDPRADRIVPPTGFTASLTLFTSGVMAFLAVFALALSLASGRLADRWSAALSQSATVRISAPDDQMQAQVRAVQAILNTTPGVAASRVLPPEEIAAMLEPWLGPDLPVATLPLPQLVEVREDGAGFDPEALRLRLAGEAPGAILDDHTRWRKPLVAAADRLRSLGFLSLALIALATAAMIALAAQSALAANGQVIQVLRLIGARDVYIARAFVRRFTLRALFGAAAGAALGLGAVALLPGASDQGGFLTGLGFQGAGWLWPLTIPPLAAIVAFWATRAAALRTLRRVP
jgi:cell division transport system permease protein